jgi:hypothetical protein
MLSNVSAKREKYFLTYNRLICYDLYGHMAVPHCLLHNK